MNCEFNMFWELCAVRFRYFCVINIYMNCDLLLQEVNHIFRGNSVDFFYYIIS